YRDGDQHRYALHIDEGRAQRAVDEAADEERLGRGAALATEERSGDLSCRVGALFDVDRQGEEVEAVTRVLPGARRAQDHRVFIEVRGNGALRLLCESAGFEPDGAGAELAVIDDGLGELDFGTFHEVSPCCRDTRGSCVGAGAG